MAYVPSSDPLCESVLLGDDQGYITMVTLSALDLIRKSATSTKRTPDGSMTTVTLRSKGLLT